MSKPLKIVSFSTVTNTKLPFEGCHLAKAIEERVMRTPGYREVAQNFSEPRGPGHLNPALSMIPHSQV